MLELRPPRPEDTRALELLARRSWPVGTHPGGLGWQAATEDMPRPMAVAERDGEIVAWAGVTGANAISEHTRVSLEGARTDPEAGAALVLKACSLTVHRGGDRVFINTAPNPLYPAPARTYAKVGFEEVDRGRVYVRRAP